MEFFCVWIEVSFPCCCSNFGHSIARLSFACPNLFFCSELSFFQSGLEGQKLFFSYMVLTKLEERHVGSDMGHRSSFPREF
jgi:hypothetical protein